MRRDVIAIKEVIFLVHHLCYKRDHLNQVREDDETKQNERQFFKANPLRFVREAKRPPRTGGQLKESSFISPLTLT